MSPVRVYMRVLADVSVYGGVYMCMYEFVSYLNASMCVCVL